MKEVAKFFAGIAVPRQQPRSAMGDGGLSIVLGCVARQAAVWPGKEGEGS